MAGLEGQKLGEYRILKRLGEGGMGQVYLAEKEPVGQQVAIKVLRPPRSSSTTEGESEPPMVSNASERFVREGLTVAKLRHPNILQVDDLGTEGDLLYLVMPYVPGGSLFDAMRGSKRPRLTLPLSAAEAAPLIFQAASALQYAHDLNIIHRDVKPENFLIRSDGEKGVQLLLADFGLVKEYHPGSGTSTMAVGTADYVAPEQIEGRPVPASDQYALAVMTYELLTGRLPFTGSVADVALKHMRQTPPAPRSINPAIPRDIEDVILTALKKRAEERWPSVAQYAYAYREALKASDQRHAGQKPISEERTVLPSPNQPRQAQKPPAGAPAPAAQPREAAPRAPQQAPAAHKPKPTPLVAQAPTYQPPNQPRPPAPPPRMPPPGYEAPSYAPLPGNVPPWTSVPPTPAPRRSITRWIILAVALLVILLIATGVALRALNPGHTGQPTSPPTPTPPPPPTEKPSPLLSHPGSPGSTILLSTSAGSQMLAVWSFSEEAMN